ncbi:4-hydroxy-tetrahydrodipicolinate synthase [Paenibacillus selenitireducens]|uniref:4-hydroxy-tetrahydrodipicolinate synthase n=1 Tax=Paenibacillus selenitireducens TaxID=1324314 RepID=A0A1T2XJS7_9BACL|nr:4-hydroxy-tetrahydrodipicolinate synthase [Paenibacillus selenitireducens]OPA80130.1 4-hydroxy-tetrahydrodipicolinate synthase [Paenibacillus selenitireducens]
MLTEQQLTGVYVPLITPFYEHGEIDLPSFHRHICRFRDAGIQGLVINGTTGESPTIQAEEIERLMAAARTACDGTSIPLVLGVGTNDTSSTIRNIERAGRLGADAVLVVVPYYSRPSQQGIIEHFRRAAEVGVPIILYEIPHRTGVALTLDTIRTILDFDGVIGIKDSTATTELVSQLASIDSKPVLCGEDSLIFSSLQAGAKGILSASANVRTDQFVALCQQFYEGNHEHAEQLFHELLPLIRLLFTESSPAPLKWMLSEQGMIQSNTLRLPLMPISPALEELLSSYV